MLRTFLRHVGLGFEEGSHSYPAKRALAFWLTLFPSSNDFHSESLAGKHLTLGHLPHQ
jgi:hypothetical protein